MRTSLHYLRRWGYVIIPIGVIAVGLILCASEAYLSAVVLPNGEWDGTSTYFDPDATSGPKGAPIEFHLRFDRQKWEMQSDSLIHVGTDCHLYPSPEEWAPLDSYGSMYAVFGENPYQGDPTRGGPRTRTIGEVSFITLGMSHGRNWMAFGYCYDDAALPICFVLMSTDMLAGRNQDDTKNCVPDTEDVLSTLRVSASATAVK